MALTQFKFWIFFAIIYIILWIVKLIISKESKYLVRINKFILLIGSYAFVFLADWRACLSLIFVTIMIYFIAINIEKYQKCWYQLGL